MTAVIGLASCGSGTPADTAAANRTACQQVQTGLKQSLSKTLGFHGGTEDPANSFADAAYRVRTAVAKLHTANRIRRDADTLADSLDQAAATIRSSGFDASTLPSGLQRQSLQVHRDCHSMSAGPSASPSSS